MSLIKLPQIQLPFSTLHLERISQKILIILISIQKDLTRNEIKLELNIKDDILLDKAIDQLLNNKPVAYIKEKNNLYSLNISQNELEVLFFINESLLEWLEYRSYDYLFTISIILPLFSDFLEMKLNQKKSKDSIYKQLQRAFEKFTDFKFIDKQLINNEVFFRINFNLFYQTCPKIKIAHYIKLSIEELQKNIKGGKLKSLCIHNLNLYYLDIDNNKIDYDLLKEMIEKGREKNWYINNNMNGNPLVYIEENKYGDFSIYIYEGKKQGKSSIKININQDKIKHAIPLSQLPFLIGSIQRSLEIDLDIYIKNLDIEDFNVTMIHYNFDFQMPKGNKYNLYMKEIQKELLMGVYLDHFLFRFYQLIGDEYRFESQITRSSNSNKSPVQLKEIIQNNEKDIIFKTIRGLMKNSIDIVNEQVETDTKLTEIIDLSRKNTNDITRIKHEITNFSTNIENTVSKQYKKTYHAFEIESAKIDDELKKIKNYLIWDNSEQILLRDDIQNVNSNTIQILSQLGKQEVLNNKNQDQIIEIFNKLTDFLGINFELVLKNINNTNKQLSNKIINFYELFNFIQNYLIKMDSKSQDYSLLYLRKLDINQESTIFQNELQSLIKKLKIKKKRNKLHYSLKI